MRTSATLLLVVCTPTHPDHWLPHLPRHHLNLTARLPRLSFFPTCTTSQSLLPKEVTQSYFDGSVSNKHLANPIITAKLGECCRSGWGMRCPPRHCSGSCIAMHSLHSPAVSVS